MKTPCGCECSIHDNVFSMFCLCSCILLAAGSLYLSGLKRPRQGYWPDLTGPVESFSKWMSTILRLAAVSHPAQCKRYCFSVANLESHPCMLNVFVAGKAKGFSGKTNHFTCTTLRCDTRHKQKGPIKVTQAGILRSSTLIGGIL